MKKAKNGKRTRRRWPRLGGLAVGGLATAVVGFMALLIVYGAMGGGGQDKFVPQITEMRSESDGEPFEGGARLHFPVDSIDMGRVPLNTEVGYAFVMTNAGDAAVHVEDANVSVLEGC